MFKAAAFTPPIRYSFYSEPESPPGILVVRNLTKREYIRGDVAKSKTTEPPFNESPFTTMVEFLGEIALYAMMWADYGAFHVPAEMEEQLARGCWAGDRIDLTGVSDDAFEGLGELTEWKDMKEAFVDVAFASQKDG